MREWRFWDWIGYACLFIAALVEAAEEALKHAPRIDAVMPSFISSGIWAFMPLILILVGTAILLWRHVMIPANPQEQKKAVTSASLIWPNPYSPVIVAGKTFRNERVSLDGHSYRNCEFHNVTFVYNGRTAPQLNNNKMFGSFIVVSDNQTVNGVLLLMLGMNMLKDNIRVGVPPDATVSPMVITPPAEPPPTLTRPASPGRTSPRSSPG